MTDKPTNQPGMICNYIVTYIDILGQREYLSGIPKLLPPEGARDGLMQSLKDTYGTVYGVRKRIIESYFDAAINRQPPTWHSTLSPKQKDILKSIETPDIHSQYFGDAIILYSKLINSQNIFNLYPAMMMLSGCATAMILGLQQGIPLRGGIEIGIAVDWEDFGIYSSALYGAYDLESKIAQYPRIVIGEELVNCLRSCKEDPRTDPIHLFNKGLADKCFSIICEDQDGMPMVDFLSVDSICSLFGCKSGNQELQELKNAVAKGFEFVKARHAKYKIEKNTKLASRYALLLDYYTERLNEWGLSKPTG